MPDNTDLKELYKINDFTVQKPLFAIIIIPYPEAQIYDKDTAIGRNVKVFDKDEKIKIHEYCDFRQATEWLLKY